MRRLGNKGIKNVSVLNLKDLDQLITDAVDNTLCEIGLSVNREELNLISEQTREKVLNILHDRDTLKNSMKNMEEELLQLKNNFELLKTELQHDNQRLIQEESGVPDKDNVSIPDRRLQELESSLLYGLEGIFNRSGLDQELQRKATSFAVELIGKERERARETAKLEQKDRIGKLKRRIAKLTAKLGETEGLLSKVNARNDIDHGVASEFKGTQGLQNKESYYEEKKMLLQEIFALNLDLKKLITEK